MKKIIVGAFLSLVGIASTYSMIAVPMDTSQLVFALFLLFIVPVLIGIITGSILGIIINKMNRNKVVIGICGLLGIPAIFLLIMVLITWDFKTISTVLIIIPMYIFFLIFSTKKKKCPHCEKTLKDTFCEFCHPEIHSEEMVDTAKNDT